MKENKYSRKKYNTYLGLMIAILILTILSLTGIIPYANLNLSLEDMYAIAFIIGYAFSIFDRYTATYFGNHFTKVKQNKKKGDKENEI